jgi:hypothetical protein
MRPRNRKDAGKSVFSDIIISASGRVQPEPVAGKDTFYEDHKRQELCVVKDRACNCLRTPRVGKSCGGGGKIWGGWGKSRAELAFDKDASQTRHYCVAKDAKLGAARPDSLGKLGTGSSLRKVRLLRMTNYQDGFRLPRFGAAAGGADVIEGDGAAAEKGEGKGEGGEGQGEFVSAVA